MVDDGIIGAAADTEPRPSVVLLDLSLTPEVDVPVVEALEDLHQRLAADGIELWLCYLRRDARDLLDRAGTLAAISSLAGQGDVLVSSTVKDIVAGSGLRFEDRGAHPLTGIPEAWHLFALTG